MILACLLMLTMLPSGGPADAPILDALRARVASGGNGSAVVNQMELAVAALEMGEDETARAALDDALTRIESVYAQNEAARKARSLWYAESVKDFKGEPYERAMAYYYRGLLALLENDLNDAGGLFHGGSVQDAFAEEEQYRSDFALFDFLEGWVAERLNESSRAGEFYARASELKTAISRPSPGHRLLVIAELGDAPRKVADGVGGYQLKFRRARGVQPARAELFVGTWQDMPLLEDVYWQASTRGGRKYDDILLEKAKVGKRADKAGAAASTAAGAAETVALVGGSMDAMHAGAAGDALAGLAFLFSARTKSRADTRYWRNLPNTIHVWTGEEPADLSALSFRFTAEDGSALDAIQPVVRAVRHPNYSIVWVRTSAPVDPGERKEGK